jgi:hypothetical protein
MDRLPFFNVAYPSLMLKKSGQRSTLSSVSHRDGLRGPLVRTLSEADICHPFKNVQSRAQTAH